MSNRKTLALVTSLTILLVGNTFAESLIIRDVRALRSSTIQLPIDISATADVAGVNVRLVYDGAIFSNPSVQAGPLLTAEHELESHSPSGGQFNVLAYSRSGLTPFAARSGTVLYILLDVDANAPAGTNDVSPASPLDWPPETPGSGVAGIEGAHIDYTAAAGSVTVVDRGDYAISGNVHASWGSGLSRISIVPGDDLATVVTGPAGQFYFEVLSGWSGTVTPVAGEWSFGPPSATLANVTTDLTNVDFTATLEGPPVVFNVVYNDDTGFHSSPPAGYEEKGSIHIGRGTQALHGTDFYGNGLNNGWLGMCYPQGITDLPVVFNVVYNDDTGFRSSPPSGYEEKGSIHIGSGTQALQGTDFYGNGLNNGWLGMCYKSGVTNPPVLFNIVYDDDTGFRSYPPTGYVERGSIHLGNGAPALTGTDFFGNGLNNGWLGMCYRREYVDIPPDPAVNAAVHEFNWVFYE